MSTHIREKLAMLESRMNPERFEQLVNAEISLQGRPIEKRVCPDQYLGLISDSVSKQHFSQRLHANHRPNNACVLMVLESPHVEEFVGDPGPAKGVTGQMIRQYLMTSISRPEIENHGLILVNAIQHQCSLGSSTVVYRDRVFRAAWAKGGEIDFCDRIKLLFRSGDLLLNCCTKGNDFEINEPLRNLVEKALCESLPGVKSTRRMHPVSWFDAKWRGKEWKL